MPSMKKKLTLSLIKALKNTCPRCNSDHMISNNNRMLSYVIRLEERLLALKDRSLIDR